MQPEQRELLQVLYETHIDVLRYVAYEKGIPKDDISDVIQDTFCSFMESYADKFTNWNEKQIKAALMTILYHRCIDYFREKQRHQKVSIEEFAINGEYIFVEELMSPDFVDGLEAQDDLRRVYESVLALSPDLRDTVMLCLIEKRPVKEASKLLGISEGTCRMRITRARRQLEEWRQNPDDIQVKKRGRPKGKR